MKPVSLKEVLSNFPGVEHHEGAYHLGGGDPYLKQVINSNIATWPHVPKTWELENEASVADGEYMICALWPTTRLKVQEGRVFVIDGVQNPYDLLIQEALSSGRIPNQEFWVGFLKIGNEYKTKDLDPGKGWTVKLLGYMLQSEMPT